jgi:hypothetical protein
MKNGRRLPRHPAWSRAPWSEDFAISARSGHLDPRRNAPRCSARSTHAWMWRGPTFVAEQVTPDARELWLRWRYPTSLLWRPRQDSNLRPAA